VLRDKIKKFDKLNFSKIEYFVVPQDSIKVLELNTLFKGFNSTFTGF
jgi:hypothetical protein